MLRRWPWPDQGAGQAASPSGQAPLRWRIQDGPWHPEETANQMVLNVAGALLSRDPENAQRLSGDSPSNTMQSASQYPADTAELSAGVRALLRGAQHHHSTTITTHPRTGGGLVR